jgi:hypothetical protein
MSRVWEVRQLLWRALETILSVYFSAITWLQQE